MDSTIKSLIEQAHNISTTARIGFMSEELIEGHLSPHAIQALFDIVSYQDFSSLELTELTKASYMLVFQIQLEVEAIVQNIEKQSKAHTLTGVYEMLSTTDHLLKIYELLKIIQKVHSNTLQVLRNRGIFND